ncbi:hypothetical protein R1sor_025613 [Riccia sorocarpa]|uniref:Uncharacterized protein n=1 Tax=Riccia sorocarpa TaxID=122646 RepID=A0ABD3GC61_9MARC
MDPKEDSLAKKGGWPSWAGESTVYFHRKADDGWWSIFKINLPGGSPNNVRGIHEERVTPPGVHAFTPSASKAGDWIAVATRRPESDYRHIEIYGSCRGQPLPDPGVPLLEPLRSPVPGLVLLAWVSLRRWTEVHVVSISNVDGERDFESKQLTKKGTGNNAFPSPSPDGKYVVFRSGRSGHKNLYIMDAVDGEEKELKQLTDGAWTDTMANWSPTVPALRRDFHLPD